MTTAPLCLSSGTIARARLGDSPTNGARSCPNQTAQSVGSLVSKSTQSIATSPPGIATAGSTLRILGALLIYLLRVKPTDSSLKNFHHTTGPKCCLISKHFRAADNRAL